MSHNWKICMNKKFLDIQTNQTMMMTLFSTKTSIQVLNIKMNNVVMPVAQNLEAKIIKSTSIKESDQIPEIAMTVNTQKEEALK